MTAEALGGLILVGGFLLLILLRVPMVFAIGFSTAATMFVLDIPLNMMVSNMVKGLNSFSLMAIPFFIFAGEIMGAGGISDQLVALAKSLIGHVRGGLAQANVLDSMFFGGISGSPVADVSSLGSIMIPIMKRDGYDEDFSAGITMASSVQALLIPPSHNMIIYATSAGAVSIAKLFVGGMVPGVVLGIALMIYVYYVSRKRNYPKGDKFSLSVFLSTFKKSILALVTIVIIVLGVTTGIFTATESAAIAVVWALIVTFAVYRAIPLRQLWPILGNTLKTLATVMAIIGISGSFGWVLSYLKIPDMVVSAVLNMTSNKIVILMLINIVLLVLGMIMDMSSIIIIATPILLPIATSIGVDPVHFGVIMIFNLGIGLITPPVGGVLFVTSGIANMKMEKLVKCMLPFYAVMFLALILITYVPAFTMFLPNLLL